MNEISFSFNDNILIDSVYQPEANPLTDPTLNLINQLNDPELGEILKQELEPEKVSDFFENISVLEGEINERLPVDDEIDNYLDNVDPNKSPEEIASDLIGIIQRHKEDIQERLHNTAMRVGGIHDKVEFLNQPLYILTKGISLAEKILNRLPEKVDEIFIAAQHLGHGLDLLGIGFGCFSIQQNAAIIRNKEEELEKLLQQLEHATLPEVVQAIDRQIVALSFEIERLKGGLQEKILNITYSYVKEVFRNTPVVLNFATTSNLIDANAKVIEKLLIASNGISLGGALISLGWSTYQVVQHSSHLLSLGKKIEKLQNQLKDLNQEDAVFAYILQSKLDRLSNVKTNYEYKLSTKVINFCAGSLSVAAATKGVMLATGLTIGSIASVGLSVAGGTGIALSLGVAAVGLGVTLYQNRYNIEHGYRSAPIEVQKATSLLSLKLMEHRLQSSKSNQSKLEKACETLQEKIENLEIVKDEGDSKKIREQMRKIEIQNKKLNSQLVKMRENLDYYVSVEEDTTNKIEDMKKEIEGLRENKKDLALERKLNNFQKKFKRYDLKSLDVIKNVINEGMEDPIIRKQIREFLLREKYEAKHDFSTEDVINYILRSD